MNSQTDSQPRIHLVIGPVGAGKSTYAMDLAEKTGGIWLNIDEWMAVLFRPDRPDQAVLDWYLERIDRCIDIIWKLVLRLVEVGTPPVCELGMLQRKDREAFYQRLDEAGVGLLVHVIDAPRAVRRSRVMKRNIDQGETFHVEVPEDIFEWASDLWQPPEGAELERDLCWVDTGRA